MKYKFSDVITCQISNYRITVNRKKKKQFILEEKNPVLEGSLPGCVALSCCA